MDEKKVETKEFTVSLRGYDRDEVDVYLGQLAEELRQLKAGAAGTPPAAASSGSADAYRQVGDETSKILVAADEAGREIRDRAQKEATSIVAEARSKAEAITRQHQADRRGFEEDIQKLREVRDTLATQLEDVGRRLAETTARLKTPIETPIPPVDRGPKPKAAEAPAREVKETPPRAEPEPPKPKAEPPPSSAPKAEAAPKPAQRAAVAEKAPPKAEPIQTTKTSPHAEAETATATQALADLLGEVRRDREESRRQVDEALSSVAPAKPAVAQKPDAGALQVRDDAIGNAPATAGRRLKRLLQEDQNYLLDRLRTHRGKGSFDESVAPLDVQIERFQAGMTDVLSDAFLAGWRASGTTETGEASRSVAELIQKQIVQPLRRDLSRIVDAGLAAGDTPKAIAERSSDVFRVWKGVRTELLGEGLVYASYHQGLVDALKQRRGTKKAWVQAEEQDCPRDVCRSNADAGPIELTSTFPSGHQTPPAHGGCTCTLTEG